MLTCFSLFQVFGGGTDSGRGRPTGKLGICHLASQTLTSEMACPAAVQDVIFHADEVACSVLRVYVR